MDHGRIRAELTTTVIILANLNFPPNKIEKSRPIRSPRFVVTLYQCGIPKEMPLETVGVHLLMLQQFHWMYLCFASS